MKAFEIFIQADEVSTADWQRLVNVVKVYESDFFVEIEFVTSTVEFYIFSQKDLSILGTKLEGFVLKPIERKTSFVDKLSQKRVNFKLPLRKNILEAREIEEIKKQRLIYKVLIHFKKILTAHIPSVTIFFRMPDGSKLYSYYYSFSNPLENFRFNFRNRVKIQKKSIPLYLKIDETAKLFSHNGEDDFLKVFGFPHFTNSLYLPLKKFEFGKHSLIVGQTGVGKSKFIELLVKNIPKHNLQDEYVVVIIDPHASLSSQFLNMEQKKITFDFIQSACDLFPVSSEPKIATELTILLFKTLLKDQFNSKTERVLKYTVYVLFLQNQMSLNTLKKFLIELEFRKQIVNSLGEANDYLVHFFETDFVEMQTKFYELAIMPVLVLIDELSFIPAFSTNVPPRILEEALKNNFLISFSLNRIFLGEKATRLLAGLIIQQLFLVAQKGSVYKKIILIIDEVSLVENESLINILAEARKFNLSLFLSQQYLTQIKPELLQGILSNVYNYFVFKTSDEDANVLAKNLEITFPDEELTHQKNKGFTEEDIKRNLLVTLNPRECVVRVFADGRFYPCFKAKTRDVR